MTDASTSGSMSPQLLEVAERARREPQGRFHSLAHLIDVEALRRAYKRQRPDAAVGIDGVTKETYGQDLEANLQVLHEKLRSKRWRHQPIRRIHIPKDKGKTRPIGISCFEDKMVQIRTQPLALLDDHVSEYDLVEDDLPARQRQVRRNDFLHDTHANRLHNGLPASASR